MWINWSCRKQGKLGPNENLLWGIGNKKHKLTSCLLPAASSKENAGVFCCRTGTGRSWTGEAVALWSKAASGGWDREHCSSVLVPIHKFHWNQTPPRLSIPLKDTLILRDGCTSPHIVSHRVLCCMKVKSGKHCRLLSASSSTEVELPQCSVSLARNYIPEMWSVLCRISAATLHGDDGSFHVQ